MSHIPTQKTKSAGGIVIGPHGKILVVSQHGTSWSLPKGHIEEGEDIEAAARREIREESGVSDLTFVKALGSYERYKIGKDGRDDLSELKNITFLLYKTAQTELEPQDGDNPEARWVSPCEVPGLLTHPKDKAFYESVRDQIL